MTPRLGPEEEEFLAVVEPPVAIGAAAETLAGCFLGAIAPGPHPGLADPRPYVAAVGSMLLFAAGPAFSRYFERAAAESRDQRLPPAPNPEPSPGLPARTLWTRAWVLLLVGAVLPAVGGRDAALSAVAVALALVLNAALGRSAWGVGFLLTGAARGMNLVMGLAVADAWTAPTLIAALPVALYGVGWAVLRASRQPGAPPTTGFVAMLHLVAAVSVLFYLAISRFAYRLDSLFFLLAFVGLTFPRFVSAVAEPRRPHVLEAVQFGLLGLGLMEAALASGYSSFLAGVPPAAVCLCVYFALRRWPVPLVLDPR